MVLVLKQFNNSLSALFVSCLVTQNHAMSYQHLYKISVHSLRESSILLINLLVAMFLAKISLKFRKCDRATQKTVLIPSKTQ